MKPAKALFAYSLLYLFGIFAAYLADSVAERAARVWRLLSHGPRDSSRSTESQKKARRSRSIAIGLALVAWSCSSTSRPSPSSAPPSSTGRCEAMAERKHEHRPRKQRSNRLVAGVCLAFFGGMVGMAYAAVPLYAMFCQMTGYGGTTQRVEQYSDRVLDREITVRFDANMSSGLPWDFKPVARDMTMKIGETAQAHYTATNLFDTPTAGRATFNVTPEMAGSYFNKVECFCFTDTTLEAGRNARYACRLLCRP